MLVAIYYRVSVLSVPPPQFASEATGSASGDSGSITLVKKSPPELFPPLVKCEYSNGTQRLGV